MGLFLSATYSCNCNFFFEETQMTHYVAFLECNNFSDSFTCCKIDAKYLIGRGKTYRKEHNDYVE